MSPPLFTLLTRQRTNSDDINSHAASQHRQFQSFVFIVFDWGTSMRSGYSIGGRARVIPVKVALWCTQPPEVQLPQYQIIQVFHIHEALCSPQNVRAVDFHRLCLLSSVLALCKLEGGYHLFYSTHLSFLLPPLPTMQLYLWQFCWRLGCVMLEAAKTALQRWGVGYRSLVNTLLANSTLPDFFSFHQKSSATTAADSSDIT